MLQAVILSGGSGSRLWPASRETYPKQLLPLTGDKTLLQITAMRLDGFDAGTQVAPPIVVTNEEYRFIIAEQLRLIGKPACAIVLEPMGRNTAPAMELAAIVARQGGEDPVLLVMPADHIVANVGAFQAAMIEGLEQARQGALVTFGIVPDRPETGYGYLRSGAVLPNATTARSLERFVEKPDLAKAEEYLASGEYLWNAGIFMMKASVWQNALQHLEPKIGTTCVKAVAEAQHDPDFIRVDKASFQASPSISIDYAVMERLSEHPELGQAVVVPLDANWNDVGAWDALWEVSEKNDESGNVIRGEVMLEDTHDSLVFSNSRLVAAVGVKDLVVVETPDAVLVAEKHRSQDVKAIVSRIKQEGKTHAASHRKIHHPWGWHDVIDTGPGFAARRLVVKPGAHFPVSTPEGQTRHWVVVSGQAELSHEAETLILAENQASLIPPKAHRKLANPGLSPLEIIEVQVELATKAA